MRTLKIINPVAQCSVCGTRFLFDKEDVREAPVEYNGIMKKYPAVRCPFCGTVLFWSPGTSLFRAQLKFVGPTRAERKLLKKEKKND